MTRYVPAFSSCLLSLALWGVPDVADACGGTFCDGGPNGMPVDQTGENVLFVMDPSGMEVHIQIQYDPNTEATKFAWVIPILEVPDFSVGSQQLFLDLLNGSVPFYGVTQQFESCGGDDGASTNASSGGGEVKFDLSPDTEGDGGPNVVLQDTVGAFDIVVLQGGTADDVMTWLGDNGYQQDPNAQPILAEYLAEGYLFAAFKLTHGAETDEIHPVVLEFTNDEACVPLRLTRIAAQNDMEVRTFFLGEHRVVPQNYRHVQVNPLSIDWLNFGANYKEVITLAVDSAGADGKAFVTEYAGPSGAANTGSLFNQAWRSGPFSMIDPVLVVDTLEQQSFLYCDPGYCDFYHPLILPLLHEFLPVPMGVEETEFYGCLSCYEGVIDTEAWDAAKFIDALEQRIILPAKHAAQLMDTWPYLTRMYTTISPHEMTEDPFFWENPDLLEVASTRIGNSLVLCDGNQVMTLPDGREVFVPAGSGWPTFPDEMPWVEDIERTFAKGAPQGLVDNTMLIDRLLAEWNAQHGWPRPSGSDDGSDDASTTTGGGPGTDGGGPGTDGDGPGTDGDGPGTEGDGPGDDTESGGASAAMDDPAVGRGCACKSGQGSSGAAGLAALGLLVGLGLSRRRR